MWVVIKLTTSNEHLTGNDDEGRMQLSLMWNTRCYLVVWTTEQAQIQEEDPTCFCLLTRILQWEMLVSKGNYLNLIKFLVGEVLFSLQVQQNLQPFSHERVLEAPRALSSTLIRWIFVVWLCRILWGWILSVVMDACLIIHNSIRHFP